MKSSVHYPSQGSWSTRFAPHLLTAAQITWLGLSIFLVIVFSVGTILRYSDLRQPCIDPKVVCFQTMRLRPVNLEGIDSPEMALRFYANFYTVEQVSIRGILWVIAALIFWKRRDHWPALLVAFWLLTSGPSFAELAAAQSWPWLFVPITAVQLMEQSV
jgi:hypothetical protein